MNFFEHQQTARRNTRVMIVLFTLAVAGVTVAMDLFIMALYVLNKGEAAVHLTAVYILGAAATLAVILLVSLYETIKLREGGQAIAEAFGARRVFPDAIDPRERQLLNVVEEMAIASGVRVPDVYILDGEQGINAFAAGFSTSDCVITVTRGLLDALNRDELQGVIGHEFSHILNGDMGLNLRMVGILAGIVFIGSVGLFLMRMGSESRDSKVSIPLILSGLVVTIIGYTGLFFARLIKAATSRQREFLADASSVQFTRNPEGIASALDQIREAAYGSRIHHRYAEEVSHMFFGQSINTWMDGLFDTHPSLDERIQRVCPGFRPSKRRAPVLQQAAPMQAGLGQAGVVPSPLIAGLAGTAGVAPSGRASDEAPLAWKTGTAEVTSLVGTTGRLEAAQNMFSAIPQELRERARRPKDACALVAALMLASKDEVRAGQIAAMQSAGAAELAAAALAVEPQTRALPSMLHFPLIDLALPTIKSADLAVKDGFFKAIHAVVYADRRVSPHEFVVMTLLRFQTSGQHGAVPVKYKTLEDVRTEALWVLSLVAHAGCSRAPEAERQKEFDAAFAAGASKMKLENAVPVGREVFGLEAAEHTLSKLRMLAPLRKAVLVQGLFACILADGKIRVIEAELMRLVCAVLDCPLPPLFEQADSISAN